MKVVRHIIGAILFCVLNRIELRYLVPVALVVEIVERSRICSLKLMGSSIGEATYVRSNIFITTPSKLSIGDSSKIGPNSELWSYGGVSIGNNVEIGSRLIIHTDDHVTSDKRLPLAKQGGAWKKVSIGDDVYIGSRVTILSGVTIGSRVIVAAGAVVTKDLESGFVYAGVPAERIKEIS